MNGHCFNISRDIAIDLNSDSVFLEILIIDLHTWHIVISLHV